VRLTAAQRDTSRIHADVQEAPDFSGRGGLFRAKVLFGARLPALLEELTEALVA